jgi:sugar lactone lactonase YvrE
VIRCARFFDATALIASTQRVGGNDGIAVDNKGNLFATGRGGVLIFDPTGKHLGEDPHRAADLEQQVRRR